MSSEPLVTIITAAYNRAAILRYAIDSVREQTYQHWQYIIVGDCCTDDTEALVAAYGDPRIEFHNMGTNSGGQSAPHNFALTLVRGDYIFYLNQDDFYFPNHIADCIEFLRHSRADMIWCPVALPLPENRNNWQQQPIILDGVSHNGKFDPATFIISSSWAMRSATPGHIGPWKSAIETQVSPSQELIFRAARKGIDLQFHPRVSVLCIHAGGRPLAYLDQDDTEHRTYFDLIYRQEEGAQKLLQRITLTLAQRNLVSDQAWLAPLKRHADKIIGRLLSLMGYHPASLKYFFKYRKDGGFINWHRNHVLKLPSLTQGQTLQAGSPDNDRFFVTGWSGAEKDFRWSLGNVSKIVFAAKGIDKPATLIVRGRPVTSQPVRFAIHGQDTFIHSYSDDEKTVEIPLNPATDEVSLTLFVSHTIAPSSLDPLSPDSRELGFMLQQLEIRNGK